MRSIKQSFSVNFEYSVMFTEGIFSPENPLFEKLLGASYHIPKIMVVIDSGVQTAHPQLISQISQYAEAHEGLFQLVDFPIIIPGGESCKNDQIYIEKILAAVNKNGIDRHSYLIAIGGGAVLDAVGYAASISHRGIRHIRIPTTVLSQNDSGVGVKNGINAFGKKNFLGSFTPPVAVINDSAFLTTLDIRDWRAGIAEAVKVSLIKDKSFYEFIEQSAGLLTQRDAHAMNQLIYRCAALHLQHIASGDPFEQGSSRPLDFGHWSGHKLEQITNYQLRHGEAVALGIALDSTYSYIIEKLPQADLIAILALLRDLGFDLFHDALQDPRLLDGLREFQEHLGGELTIMLLQGIGEGLEVHEMDHELILQSIKLLGQYDLSNSLGA